MRGESHRSLGRYLAEKYMSELPKRYQTAFWVGCIEPDRNPATYLKGSIRCQWLRGHNYGNAKRFMFRISRRLERKEHLNLFDYYTLGKLIHYTTDAFTYAHNEEFTTDLGEHLEYETALQHHFLEYMRTDPHVRESDADSITDAIRIYHREYIRKPANIHTDTKYALKACCCILALLLTPRII